MAIGWKLIVKQSQNIRQKPLGLEFFLNSFGNKWSISPQVLVLDFDETLIVMLGKTSPLSKNVQIMAIGWKLIVKTIQNIRQKASRTRVF